MLIIGGDKVGKRYEKEVKTAFGCDCDWYSADTSPDRLKQIIKNKDGVVIVTGQIGHSTGTPAKNAAVKNKVPYACLGHNGCGIGIDSLLKVIEEELVPKLNLAAV